MIAFNRTVDRRAAENVAEHFFEGVVAPGLRRRGARDSQTQEEAASAGRRGPGQRGADRIRSKAGARRNAGPGLGPGHREGVGLPGRHHATPDGGGVEGSRVRLDGLQTRQVQRDRLHLGGSDPGRRGGTDEPGRFGEDRHREGPVVARGSGDGLRRFLPLPGRRRHRRRGRDSGRDPARRFGAGQGGRGRGRRVRHDDWSSPGAGTSGTRSQAGLLLQGPRLQGLDGLDVFGGFLGQSAGFAQREHRNDHLVVRTNRVRLAEMLARPQAIATLQRLESHVVPAVEPRAPEQLRVVPSGSR